MMEKKTYDSKKLMMVKKFTIFLEPIGVLRLLDTQKVQNLGGERHLQRNETGGLTFLGKKQPATCENSVG
jgi:hypothetical protein